jgi:lipoyl(octanoyl) transferase
MQSTAKKPMAHERSDRSLHIIDCGLADYREVLARQHELCENRRRDEIPNTVLILEHLPVITLGARRSANKLLVDRDELARRGIDLVQIRRGGGTTAHNPGQLVFYPIVHLHHLGLGISDYIRKLEEIGIDLLGQLGVTAERRKGFPGLWVENDHQSSIVNRQSPKIASIGVRISKFVAHHGMAINICNDLSIFELLVPCGLEDVEMTSVLKETNRRHPMSNVKYRLSRLLMTHFSVGVSGGH